MFSEEMAREVERRWIGRRGLNNRVKKEDEKKGGKEGFIYIIFDVLNQNKI